MYTHAHTHTRVEPPTRIDCVGVETRRGLWNVLANLVTYVVYVMFLLFWDVLFFVLVFKPDFNGSTEMMIHT